MEDLINDISKQVPDVLKLNNRDEIAKIISDELEKSDIKEVIKLVEKIVEDSRPRYLTKEEIQNILLQFNEPGIPIKKVAEVYIKSLRKKLKEILKQVELAPKQIPEFTNQLIRQYNISKVAAGTPIGLWSVEAITQYVTQMTLSSFHSSGTAKVSPLDRLEQIINTTRTENKKLNYIFFNDELLSRNDIEEKKRNIQVLALGIFVKDSQIETVNELKSRNDYFYPIYEKLFPNKNMESTYVLRLYLDEATLNFYHVTLEDIAHAIDIADFSSEENDNYVKTIISPSKDLIIDVYLNDDIISETETKKLSVSQVIEYSIRTLVFISQILLPSLDSIIVKGVFGVKSFDIANELIPLFLISEKQIKPGQWKIRMNWKSVLRFGMTEKKLSHFLNLVGIKLVKYSKKKIIVDSVEPPIGVINFEINKSDGDLNSEVYNYNSIFYGITEGGDLQDILEREDVDPYTTYSDNIHETIKLLGVEASRNFLTIDISKTIGANPSDIPVSSRHMLALSDWMTNLGKLTSMTVAKIKEYEEGYNNLATIGKTVDFYEKAAATGSFESTNTVANAICLGMCPPVGTGIVKLTSATELKEIVNAKNEGTKIAPVIMKAASNVAVNMPIPSTTTIKKVDDIVSFDESALDLNLKSTIMNDVLTRLDENTRNIDNIDDFEETCDKENKSKKVTGSKKKAAKRKKIERKVKMEEFDL